MLTSSEMVPIYWAVILLLEKVGVRALEYGKMDSTDTFGNLWIYDCVSGFQSHLLLLPV